MSNKVNSIPSYYQFDWDFNNHRFTSEPTSSTEYLSKESLKKFRQIILQIESQSGVDPKSDYMHMLIFLVVNIVNFSISYYLIVNGRDFWGALCLIGVPFFTFFTFIGNSLIQGTQLSRVNRFMLDKRDDFNLQLGEIGFQIFYSFMLSTIQPNSSHLIRQEPDLMITRFLQTTLDTIISTSTTSTYLAR